MKFLRITFSFILLIALFFQGPFTNSILPHKASAASSDIKLKSSGTFGTLNVIQMVNLNNNTGVAIGENTANGDIPSFLIYNSDFLSLGAITAISAMTDVYGVAKLSNGNFAVYGKNGTSDVIQVYTPTGSYVSTISNVFVGNGGSTTISISDMVLFPNNNVLVLGQIMNTLDDSFNSVNYKIYNSDLTTVVKAETKLTNSNYLYNNAIPFDNGNMFVPIMKIDNNENYYILSNTGTVISSGLIVDYGASLSPLIKLSNGVMLGNNETAGGGDQLLYNIQQNLTYASTDTETGVLSNNFDAFAQFGSDEIIGIAPCSDESLFGINPSTYSWDRTIDKTSAPSWLSNCTEHVRAYQIPNGDVVAYTLNSNQYAIFTTATATPATPTNFNLTEKGDTYLKLSWDAVSGATSYTIQRGATVIYSGTATSYTDTGLSAGTNYSYTVYASNAGGDSSTASTSGTTIPSTPTGFTTTSITSTSIGLSWNSVSGATSYTVTRNGTTIYSGAGTSFNDTGLSPNTSYNYAVYATNAGGNSSSATLSPTTIGGGTLNISQTAITFSAATFSNIGTITSTGSTTVTVDDQRGSGAGWSVSLAITDLIASLADPTAPSTSTINVAIPASAVQAVGGSSTLVSGQAVNGTYGPMGLTKTLSNSAQSIINASPGYGNGKYTTPVNFTLAVPKTVVVQSISGTGSKYTAGSSEIGTVAGTYSSTFMFTATAGL